MSAVRGPWSRSNFSGERSELSLKRLGRYLPGVNMDGPASEGTECAKVWRSERAAPYWRTLTWPV